MSIHSSTPKIGFVLLMCALLGFLLLACVTSPSPAPTAPPPTPTSPPPTPTEPPTPVPTQAPAKPTVAPSRTPGATPTTSPGNTITFKDTLTAGGEDTFLVLCADNAALHVSVKPNAGLQVTLELQKSDTKKVLFTAKENNPLVALIPDSGLYRIVVRNEGKSGGDYSATFVGTKGVGFSLDPKFVIMGRLPDDSSLSYLYTGRPGSTLSGAFVPDAKADLIIKVYRLEDVKNALLTVNKADLGKAERLDFILPKSSNSADTYLITVSEAKGTAGQYLMKVETKN